MDYRYYYENRTAADADVARPSNPLRSGIAVSLAVALALTFGAAAAVTPAAALSAKDCPVKYQTAKMAGTRNGQKWNDVRKSECRAAPDVGATNMPNPVAPAATKTAALAPTTTAAKPAPVV